MGRDGEREAVCDVSVCDGGEVRGRRGLSKLCNLIVLVFHFVVPTRFSHPSIYAPSSFFTL